ncbi:MAG: TonB family protein [Woeseiaceae bacterium]
MLLHSEQSTLDTLSSGFGDSYTVHCATSGSEALNTLGDTPINVIVSAHKLPGMSGLDALREAKKRSPDTIGILLAENEDKGLEALVSEKEVFQVVRGNITSQLISKLVDEATQQMRLMALATSANDSAANVDSEPAEHIIMETSEHGATIISDGTGRMPVLDPTKVSAASALGSHSVDLLVLTKDNEFLDTIKQSSRGTHEVHYATTLAQADNIIREHKVGVAVVDAAMVGEKIEQLTAHLRKGSPRLVSIVAGRRDDGEMMMDLINRSKVYRFLLKPVSPGRARLAVEASVKHHLEAPDAAFKIKGSETPAAATPAGRTPSRPKPTPSAPPKDRAEPRADKPKTDASQIQKANFGDDPPLSARDPAGGKSPNDDALSEAFGSDDSSFTETVTGLFATVSKKLTGTDDDDGSRQEIQKDDTSAPAPGAPHMDLDDTGGSAFSDPRILGLGAVAIVVIAGGLFWLMSGSDETVDSPVSTESTPAVAETREAPEPPPVADEATLVEEPLDSQAQIVGAIADAESALLESRIDEASAALELLGRVDPGNERLPFLTAQLAQIQLRSYLDEARAAIRDSRFEDAGSALAAARSLNLADSADVDAAEQELAAAQDAQQSGELLALANARLEEGALLKPANDNARYFYEMALSNDPDNLSARQGLSAIASKLAMQARTATDDGNLDAAEALLVESTALDPDNSELKAAIGALADKRAAIAAERRQAEARRRAAAEKRAADERAAQERKAEEERKAAAAAAAAAAAPAVEAATMSEDNAVAETRNDDAAGSAALDAGQPDAQTPVEQAASLATPVAPQGPTPGAISDMKRIKYVAPKYPRAAERRNLSGWVDVIFTVDKAGEVKDVIVRESEPGETFVDSAVRAVEKWRFEPVIENGQAVEKRVGVRMMFALE